MMVTFEGKEGVRRFQLVALKNGMKLSMLGIQPGRGWTRKAMLTLASTYTGKEYKRGIKGFEEAYVDICAVVDETKNAG
jgi:hypothetical protein